MLKKVCCSVTLATLALLIAAAPGSALGQSTNKPPKAAPESKEAGKAAAKKEGRKNSGHPFHGKLAAVDKFAKTITIGETTYQIGSETRIQKAGKPATLEDGVIGEECSGYVKANPEGKKVATSVTFGAKPEGKGKKKGQSEKSEKPEKSAK